MIVRKTFAYVLALAYAPSLLVRRRSVLSQGYAMLEQIVSGLHTRLYARAYIVADPSQDRCDDWQHTLPLLRRLL